MSNTRQYPCMLPKSEWVAPSNLKIGDAVVVLHSNTPKSDSAQFTDLAFSRGNVVARIKHNGTVILENGRAFHATGYGHAKNGALVLSDRHVIERDAAGMAVLVNGEHAPATTLGHHSTF